VPKSPQHPPIYLDHHATAPVDPRVLDAMLPFFGPKFGNAASRSHRFGWEAEQSVEFARKRVAALAGATAREIVFTSGATESNNLALKGAIEALGAHGNHIVTVATEHSSVLDPVRHLERLGASATIVLPRPDGILDLDLLRDAIKPQTVLVSVMWANNEIGVIQPIAEIGAICREKNVVFHCDAAQAFGKIPVDVNAGAVDLMSLSAHKLYGPKGVGALYVRRRKVKLASQMDGGGHESGLRSGTLNVPGIVGFGQACALCATGMAEESARTGALRDRLLRQLLDGLEAVTVNGSLDHRLPGNLNLSFAGVNAETLLMNLPEIALSTGSACSSAVAEPSHVLRALKIGKEQAGSAVRFGIGRSNTAEEIDFVAGRVIEAVKRLRAFTPVL
jgi:cysteine desulfurase